MGLGRVREVAVDQVDQVVRPASDLAVLVADFLDLPGQLRRVVNLAYAATLGAPALLLFLGALALALGGALALLL
eukprot:1046606-Pyramimonas_sp.AAC.1